MSAPAGLDYAPPPEPDAAESAAVWRVAWWAGLLWATTATMRWGSYTWDTFTGTWWADGGPTPISVNATIFAHTALGVAATVTLAVLLCTLRTRNHSVIGTAAALAVAATFASAAAFAAAVARNSVAGTAWPSLLVTATTYLLNAGGGATVLLLAALRRPRLTGTLLMLLVAATLLADPVINAVSVAGRLAGGEPPRQVWADEMSWSASPYAYSAAAKLTAAVVLLLAASSAPRRRWPMLAAASLALLAAAGEWAWNVAEIARRPELMSDGPLLGVVWQTGASLVAVAPALALLAWRPPAAEREGR